jgi:peptidyl-prolyl cis-trans isomerase B (cyclophilin B)
MTTFSPESRAILKTSMGDITLEFLDDAAPRTCEHFVKLARQGFYDGLTFHRVLKGFIIQGGCPKGDGTGGPGFTLRAEFNDTPHVKGTVSMARGNDPHSAGSQFFIVNGDARYLDHRYTAFAKVVDGMATVDKIAGAPVTENRWKEASTPRDPVFINRIVLEGIEFDAEEPGAGPAPAQQSAPQPQRGQPQDQDDDEDALHVGDDEPEDDDDGEEPSAEMPADQDEPEAAPAGDAGEGEPAPGGKKPAEGGAAAGGKPAGSRSRHRRGGRRRRKE